MTALPTVADEPATPVPMPPRQEPSRWTVWLLRVALAALALACLSQPVSIGQYLDGVFGGLSVHATIANVIGVLAILAVAAGVLHVWRGRGRWHLLPALLVLFVAIVLQVGFGYSRSFGLHVPLGVLIVGMSVVLAVWSWTPRVRRVRGRVDGTS